MVNLLPLMVLQVLTSLTLKVTESPVLKLRILNTKELGHRLGLTVTLGNGEGEGLIRRKANRLGTVLRSVDLQTDVKVLTGEEVGPGIN
jgi:hypothetical protein